MTGDTFNPVRWEDIESGMTEAEKQFVECLARGNPCILGNAVPKAQESGAHNTVRSEVIRFFAFGGDEAHPVRGTHIILEGARVPPDISLNLIYGRIPYLLGMHNCLLESDILMIGAQCISLSLADSHLHGRLVAEGAKIDGNVLMRRGFVATGEIRLTAAHIGGFLDCENGKFLNPGKMAIVADSVRVDGNVWLRGGFFAEGEVRISAARIGGELDCSGGRFDNPGECALRADGAYVRSRIVMRRASIAGGARLIGAYTNGELDCEGGRFDGGEGVSLHADKVTAGRGIALHEGFFASGEVRLLGARTDGNLNCSSGKFHNNLGQKALSADLAHVGGTVSLGDEFSARGEVRFPGACIGALECDGKFENLDAIALDASDMEARGGIALRAQFQGEVTLIGAHIGRSLSVTGTLDNPRRIALNAERVEAKEGIAWVPEGGEGAVNLGFARVGTLVDTMEAWEPFDKIALNGFIYGQFADPADVQSRIDWLSKRPDEGKFSPQPYEQAAKALFRMGYAYDAREILLEKERIRMRQEKESDKVFSPVSHDAVANILFAMGRNRDAREILLERERLLTERGGFSRIWRWGRKIWGALGGYGYRPWQRTFLTSLVITAVGSILFDCGERAGQIVPHQPAALVSSKYQYGRIPAETPDETVARKFSGYPEFSPILFSVDIFVPFLNLHQESFWYPAPNNGHQRWRGSAENGEFSWWVLLEWWYWFQIIAGWTLTSMLLLFAPGLLRPHQPSGEKN